MNKRRQQLKCFVWACKQNEVEKGRQIKVTSIEEEEDAYIFEFTCQESSMHPKIVMTDSKICSEVEAQNDFPKKSKR